MNNSHGIWPDENVRILEFGISDVFKSLRVNQIYKIAGSVWPRVESFNDKDRLKATELLRRKALGNELPYILINTSFLDEAEKIVSPSIGERFDRGIRCITDTYPEIGVQVDLSDATNIQSKLCGALYTNSFREVAAFLRAFEKRGLIQIDDIHEGIGLVRFRTTISAFADVDLSSSANAFVAMWFNEEVNSVYDEAIEPAIRDAGYIPRRIDRSDFNGKIDDEIIAEIRRSKFVIADFTSKLNEPRGGVYYEAGFAQGLGLSVIWTARNDMFNHLHFDTRQYNHIGWDNAEDLKPKLYNRILATIGVGPHVAI
ncbi:hypothetical protein [Hirschia litorea]|uniref:Nucleoside 2-deoxyribosyltransferase n=1 Tax=Hirschia litorea TaxID=1199156 RepID=A0ABW2II76_9PROT